MVAISSFLSRSSTRLGSDVDAEVGADLVAEHAADAVVLVSHVHRKPAERVGGGPVGEDVGGAHVEAEAARLAHVLADEYVPQPGGAFRRFLLSLEQRHGGSPVSSSSARSPWRWRCGHAPAARHPRRRASGWRRRWRGARRRRSPAGARSAAGADGSDGWRAAPRSRGRRAGGYPPRARSLRGTPRAPRTTGPRRRAPRRAPGARAPCRAGRGL